MQNLNSRWILLGVVAVTCIAVGLSRVSFNIDILDLLPAKLQEVQGLSLFLKNFAQPNELVITLEADDADSAELAADSLAAHLQRRSDLVKQAVARPSWEKNPADLAELLAFALLNEPPDKIGELTARLSPDQAPKTLTATLATLSESISPQKLALASHDPYDLGAALATSDLLEQSRHSEFASADGTFRVIYVEAVKPFGNYKATIAWLRAIKQEAAQWRGQRDVKLGFTGEPAFVADISGSMEWDMMSSGAITLVVIALIFWLCYRRAEPLLILQALLILIFTVSLAIAGLVLEQLTVIGVGCAAIMIGLSVDYGYFVYQHSRQQRGTVRALQRLCLQNIMWTAGTTAAAFFALNLSSLPGLSQLGNLVGIGVIVGAVVMLGVFAPITARFHRLEQARPASLLEQAFANPRFQRYGAWFTLMLVGVLLGALVCKGFPAATFSPSALRSRANGASIAMDRLASRLTDDRDTLSLVIAGQDETEVLALLQTTETHLEAAKAHGTVVDYHTARQIWPNAEHQKCNLPILAQLETETPRLRQTLEAAGFRDEAFSLTEAVLKQWKAWARRTPPVWPDNDSSRWIFRRCAKHAAGQVLAMGIVQPATGQDEALSAAVERPGVYLVSWSRLGAKLKRVIPREIAQVACALIGGVVLLLAMAFRSARAVGLFVATTALVLLCLAGAMSLLGITWNFFNLAAVLLLLGTGTDYSILLLLALSRNGGDVPAAQRELGLVILLCASSAAAGFGTISWANHLGLASLGQTCALGLIIDALISFYLLPRAWALIHPGRRKTPEPNGDVVSSESGALRVSPGAASSWRGQPAPRHD